MALFCDHYANTDYGALWSGCLAPFIHQSVSVERFLTHLGPFSEDVFKYFFRPHLTNQFVSEEDYVRFMSWFANFDETIADTRQNVSQCSNYRCHNT